MKRIPFGSVESTNDVARTLGEINVVVVAERQSHGRGRNGRVWISGTGGLYASFVLEKRRLLPFITAISAAEVIESYIKASGGDLYPVEIRWPNDIVVSGKKICGILCEGHRDFDIAGVGININNDPCLENATSIKELTGAEIAVTEMLDSLICAMEKNLLRPDADIMAEYRERCRMLGKRVRVGLTDGIVEGIAGMDEDGYLVVDGQRIGVAEAIKVEKD